MLKEEHTDHGTLVRALIHPELAAALELSGRWGLGRASGWFRVRFGIRVADPGSTFELGPGLTSAEAG